MKGSNKYKSAFGDNNVLGTVVPSQLVNVTAKALHKLKAALGGDVGGYVAQRLHMKIPELCEALAAEQIDGVALAMYNIEMRSQSVIIGDQTGIGKGRQAAALIRYGIIAGYLPIFFTDRYTLFSDMYRDCKALGINSACPLIVNSGVEIVDFDEMVEEASVNEDNNIFSSVDSIVDKYIDNELLQMSHTQYKVVYKSPSRKTLRDIFLKGDIPKKMYSYLMITYSQLKDTPKDDLRLKFLLSLCEKYKVLFIFDEAHRGSSVSAGNVSVITQGINRLLSESPQSQCVFLSATFAKRPENLLTFMQRTSLSALATEKALEKALHDGGVPMQEYVSSTLVAEGQMIRREHFCSNMPEPRYTYLDDELEIHSELFNKVMYYFREIVKLSDLVAEFVTKTKVLGVLQKFKNYPTRAQLFYLNKILLLSLKADKIAQIAVENVRSGRSVVIGMSDTLECVLQDVDVVNGNNVCGDISKLLIRLLEKTVRDSNKTDGRDIPIYEMVNESDVAEMPSLREMMDEIRICYQFILKSIAEDTFHLPISPIDIIRQQICKESYVAPDGTTKIIRFEECTGRSKQLEYLCPDGQDDYVCAQLITRKKRHTNCIFNDFQNNKLDVILINACGAIGASAHAVATAEVPYDQVRQRIMLIVQNDLDVNIDLQKRGRIYRTGQRKDLLPLYEYIITAIPSEKRLNMMLRTKLRSLSANTAAWQDQDKGQADFIDISNKYGNKIANDYLREHVDLAKMIGIKSTTSADQLLAKIAMLPVHVQQEIVDELFTAYAILETELRRINQWDLEREYRDFDAEFIREELFTAGKANNRLAGCSYLTTFKCKQKKFPYSYSKLNELCEEAKKSFGCPYRENKSLQKEIDSYYIRKNKTVREQFAERRKKLYADTERVLANYEQDENFIGHWLDASQVPCEHRNVNCFAKIRGHKNEAQIFHKLSFYSETYNHLLDREKEMLHKYAEEKKRLIKVLSKAVIGNGFANVKQLLAEEECHSRVIAVLRDICFGKDERTKFQPNQVQLVFALTAVHTETRINMVHNNNWSNYERLLKILDAEAWNKNAYEWNEEISKNNNKEVVRRIITGNVLGAFVHPAIYDLNPRLIMFSVKNGGNQHGLLLPMNEDKIRETLKTVSLPLQEGMRYANNTNTSYVITGIGVDFSLLPFRIADSYICFVISVYDGHSKLFEEDQRFKGIKDYFDAKVVSSIHNQSEQHSSKRRLSKHYTTKQLSFESDTFQTIIKTLVQLDAVLIVPREQMTGREVKQLISQSERDDNMTWPVLNWRNEVSAPMPPKQEITSSRIYAPVIPRAPKGKQVFRHSTIYMLSKETMEMRGLSLDDASTKEKLVSLYLKWKCFISQHDEQQTVSLISQKLVLSNLRDVIENKVKAVDVNFNIDVLDLLQKVLDSEHLEVNSAFISRFDHEMLFRSPNINQAKIFLDELPYTERLDGIRKCIEDYIEGKTDIIYSPDRL